MVAYRIIPAGDIDLRGGQVVMLRGADYVRQKLSTRFRFFIGESFLDLREGVPYFRDVFVKNPDLDLVRSVFRAVLLSVPEVATITTFDLVFDPTARTLAFDFEVQLVAGGTLIVQPADTAFILAIQAAA